MTDWDPIQAYLIEFARRLPIRGRRANRVLDEVEGHLRERTEDLCRQGMEPTAAAAAAVERFGSPSDVLRQFESEAPIESEVETMIRYFLMPTAGLSFLFGAAFMVGSWFDDAPSAMFIAKIVSAVLMMACGLLLFYLGWATRPLRNWERGLALAAAIISIMIGSAGSVFTAHLGLVTHDWEMYGFAGAGLLILQGVLATVQLLDAKPRLPNLA